jgi:hypothetical protein
VLGTAYLVCMLGVDVPMYWAGWVSEAPRGHQALGTAEGFLDAASWRFAAHGAMAASPHPQGAPAPRRPVSPTG